MPRVALGLYALFLVVAVGWRSWAQYRRTGDHGFRGVSGNAASEWIGGTLLVAGLVLAAAGPAAELLGMLEPVRAPFASLANVAGLLLALAGFWLTLVAQLQMGSSWRIGVDAGETTPLVTEGLFRFVRNPIFSGMMLACAGGLLLAPNALSLLALLSVVAGLEIHVRRVEEPYLARIHGARYRAYAGRVGRFVPRCGRLA